MRHMIHGVECVARCVLDTWNCTCVVCDGDASLAELDARSVKHVFMCAHMSVVFLTSVSKFDQMVEFWTSAHVTQCENALDAWPKREVQGVTHSV